MKAKEIEKMLSEQIAYRLNKLEDDQDAVGVYKLSEEDYRKLKNEVQMLEEMRARIHENRSTQLFKYIELGVKTAVPAAVTVVLSLLGYGLEGLFGNACSKTLQSTLSRSPKM